MAPQAGEPHKGKYVAYYRVSTDKQGQSGLGLSAQKAAVKRYLNGGDWEIIGEFTEVESGRKGRRPAYDYRPSVPELAEEFGISTATARVLLKMPVEVLTIWPTATSAVTSY